MDREEKDWKRLDELCFKWPTTGEQCKEVFENIMTGERLTKWYNELGILLASRVN